MGDLRLRPALRRRALARRPPRRPVRPPADVRRRPRRLLRQLAALRACLVGRLTDRLPRDPGTRRRAARTRCARAADDDVRRGPRAQSGPRDLRCRLRKRRRRRRPARRTADLVPQLVLDLLHQRPGRPDGDRARTDAAPREPRSAAPPPLRPRRRSLDHRRPDAARLRDDTRDQRRLGHRPARSRCSPPRCC